MRNDIFLVKMADVWSALGLLTRLPIKVDFDAAKARGAASAWAYPIVGIIIGLISVIVAGILVQFSVPTALIAGAVLAVQIVITGAMHEDGLADTADGLWGGWDRDQRLNIMKDSHIGTYGVLALVLSVGLRWVTLSYAILLAGIWVLPAVAALSRAPMTATMAMLPNARTGGFSSSVGRPSLPAAGLAAIVAVLAGGLMIGAVIIPLAIAVTAVTIAAQAIAMAKIEGQTGDILGANQQLAEIAALVTLCAILS